MTRSLLTLAFWLSLSPAVLAQDRAETRLVVENAGSDSACFTGEELRESVAARLGYDPFSDSASDLVTVQVQRRSSASFVARVALSHGGQNAGERELRASNCAELRALLELTVALAVDPLASSSPRATQQEEVHEAATPAAPTPPTEMRLAPQVYITPVPEPRTPAQPLLGFDVHLSSGTAPSLAYGASVMGGLQWNRISLRFEVRGDLPASASVGMGEVVANIVLASVLACVRVSYFDVCGGMRAGAQRNTGRNLENASSFTSGVAAVAVRANFNLPLSSSWALVLGGELGLAFTQTTVFVDNSAVWTTPLLSFGALFGPIYRFP